MGLMSATRSPGCLKGIYPIFIQLLTTPVFSGYKTRSTFSPCLTSTTQGKKGFPDRYGEFYRFLCFYNTQKVMEETHDLYVPQQL